ncbi:MAG: hypothetical protein H7249_14990 [Chitinophagaceae bacterium]|nr:hypothetical protein [Oligoflexus sp.]
MKKVEANRYPHSATLFKFCKEALEIRYDGNVKVIDQDVGAILGYDPADCSHWKKGKKNIRSLTTLRSIAEHLNVDEGLLIDITSGKVTLDEAVFEFKGYGDFMLSGKPLEALKKDYFKNPSRWQGGNQIPTFEVHFHKQRKQVVALANELVEQGGFTETPLYIPEIYRLVPNVSIGNDPDQTEAFTVRHDDEGAELKTVVNFQSNEARPYLRFMAGKALFKHLVGTGRIASDSLSDTPSEIVDILSNVFAGALLIPSELLRGEVQKLDMSFDMIRQLSEVFWVSRSLMNQRLRDFLEHGD